MTTGKELELERVRLDINSITLARAIGVHQSQISRWENARIVTDKAAVRYREGLERCAAVATQAA